MWPELGAPGRGAGWEGGPGPQCQDGVIVFERTENRGGWRSNIPSHPPTGLWPPPVSELILSLGVLHQTKDRPRALLSDAKGEEGLS